MSRVTALSLLASALLPASLLAMPGKDVRDAKKKEKDEKVQQSTDTVTKNRKAKPGPSADDIEVGKKKLKARPGAAAPVVKPQDDDEGEILWDTEFLVRSTIPTYSGQVVYTKY